MFVGESFRSIYHSVALVPSWLIHRHLIYGNYVVFHFQNLVLKSFHKFKELTITQSLEKLSGLIVPCFVEVVVETLPGVVEMTSDLHDVVPGLVELVPEIHQKVPIVFKIGPGPLRFRCCCCFNLSTVGKASNRVGFRTCK